MKQVLYILLFFWLLQGCEDVIDVDLPEEQPKLVVDALIRLNFTQPSSPFRVKVSTTGSFFDAVTPTPLERMQLVNEDITTTAGILFLIPDPNTPNEYVPLGENGSPEPGDLVSNDFFLEGRLILTFVFNSELYLSETRFVPAPPFNSIEQGDGTTFGDDTTELIVEITDLPEQDNFYVFDYDFGEFGTLEDRFFQDQSFKFYHFYDSELNPGDQATISILSGNEDFYNSMGLLIEQSDLTDGGPFQVPVTTVRGNILKVEGVYNIDLFDNVGRPQEFTETITIE
ncbi:MAG: hypothetical protein ACJARZ_001782 [Dokdonia sp.]